MKKQVALFIMLLIAGHSFAQFENTKWAGKLMIPSETDCYFHFRRDSLTLYLADNDYEVEAMNYKISKDTIKIRKLHGSSPCSDDAPAIYLWSITDDKLILKELDDNCPERSTAFLGAELTKMKTPEAVKPKE